MDQWLDTLKQFLKNKIKPQNHVIKLTERDFPLQLPSKKNESECSIEHHNQNWTPIDSSMKNTY